MKNIPAYQLKVGDIIKFTDEKVIVEPSAGLYTPAGKCELTVENRNGTRVTKTWNKKTLISIV